MLWFPGTIPAAIAAAKQRSAVFVVFVQGQDEQSTEMAASWENAKVSEAATDDFVAIKIDTQRYDLHKMSNGERKYDGRNRRKSSKVNQCVNLTLKTDFGNWKYQTEENMN